MLLLGSFASALTEVVLDLKSFFFFFYLKEPHRFPKLITNF